MSDIGAAVRDRVSAAWAFYGIQAIGVAVSLAVVMTYTQPRSYAYAPAAFGTAFTKALFLLAGLSIVASWVWIWRGGGDE